MVRHYQLILKLFLNWIMCVKSNKTRHYAERVRKTCFTWLGHTCLKLCVCVCACAHMILTFITSGYFFIFTVSMLQWMTDLSGGLLMMIVIPTRRWRSSLSAASRICVYLHCGTFSQGRRSLTTMGVMTCPGAEARWVQINQVLLYIQYWYILCIYCIVDTGETVVMQDNTWDNLCMAV